MGGGLPAEPELLRTRLQPGVFAPEIRCDYKEANYYYQLAYDNMVGVDQDVIAARDRTLNILKKNM